jgi:hypothetical protein
VEESEKPEARRSTNNKKKEIAENSHTIYTIALKV